MRISTDNGGDGAPLVNLTPLIDVVFLLLIFFMVTAQFQEDERDLTVDLPGAENGDPIKDLPKVLFVNVRKDGSLTVGDRSLDTNELRSLLARAKRKNPDQRVVVRADADVALRHPVDVFDVCMGLRIPFSMATHESGRER